MASKWSHKIISYIILAHICGWGYSKEDDHICKLDTYKYNITKIIKYQQPVTTEDYEWCLNLPPRCPKRRTEIRERSKVEVEERTEIITRCCPGYALKNGKCNAICPPGFTGIFCQERCGKGFWGGSCNQQCMCPINAVCDSTDGKCICKSGWVGVGCDEPEFETSTEKKLLFDWSDPTTKTTEKYKPTTKTTTPTPKVTDDHHSSTVTTEKYRTTQIETKRSTTTSSTSTTTVSPVMSTTLKFNATEVSVSKLIPNPATTTMSDSKIIFIKNKIWGNTTKFENKAMSTRKYSEESVHYIKPKVGTKYLTTTLLKSSVTIPVSSPTSTTPMPTKFVTQRTTIQSKPTTISPVTVLTPTKSSFHDVEIPVTINYTKYNADDLEETHQILTEPEHITSVAGDKNYEGVREDYVNIVSIVFGVVIAIILLAIIIVFVERHRRRNSEREKIIVLKNMKSMMRNDDDSNSTYIRSIFHNPLPDPPDCNTKSEPFYRHVVINTISPIMIENYRGILESHYDHLPCRDPRLASFQPDSRTPSITFMAPSPLESDQSHYDPPKCPAIHLPVTDETILTLRQESFNSGYNNEYSNEPLYDEISNLQPPFCERERTSASEAVTEL